jgi:predicted nucleic acid-binding protein
MDTAELLSGGASFVIDTSAWWRLSALPHVRRIPGVRRRAVRSTDAPNDRAVANTAMSALSELAARSDGYHRVSITDALIAAAAAEHGGLAVLHKDGHFDRLAEVLAFESVALPID